MNTDLYQKYNTRSDNVENHVREKGNEIKDMELSNENLPPPHFMYCTMFDIAARREGCSLLPLLRVLHHLLLGKLYTQAECPVSTPGLIRNVRSIVDLIFTGDGSAFSACASHHYQPIKPLAPKLMTQRRTVRAQ